jgi:adenine-specific DNA-methyltransferase
LGSKRLLIPHISAIVEAIGSIRRVCDLFAGTTRVGQALKARGYDVVSNDLATYSEVFGRTFIETDARTINHERLVGLLAELQALPPQPGYITRTFCEAARYFQPHNGAAIDAIRAGIDTLAPAEPERSIALTSLLLAADRVDSTTGLQMAYLKAWAPRSFQRLELRMPALLPGPGQVLRQDANTLARDLDGIDLVYIDPPYNQHSYFANYHVWETLVRNDSPATYGVAQKRLDCQTVKSPYNLTWAITPALLELLAAVRAPYLLVSFNDEGRVAPATIERALAERGYVASARVGYKRYVGAQIGIFNPSGQPVGQVSHLRNHEHLFLVGPSRQVVEAAMRMVPAVGS